MVIILFCRLSVAQNYRFGRYSTFYCFINVISNRLRSAVNVYLFTWFNNSKITFYNNYEYNMLFAITYLRVLNLFCSLPYNRNIHVSCSLVMTYDCKKLVRMCNINILSHKRFIFIFILMFLFCLLKES